MFEGLFQPMHLLVIFGIALIVFGPKKLPELGKGIGEGIRGFKSAMYAGEEKPGSTTGSVGEWSTAKRRCEDPAPPEADEPAPSATSKRVTKF